MTQHKTFVIRYSNPYLIWGEEKLDGSIKVIAKLQNLFGGEELAHHITEVHNTNAELRRALAITYSKAEEGEKVISSLKESLLKKVKKVGLKETSPTAEN